ncbi:unnamed protein product, partial [Rhizoctonia solani]
REPSPHASSAPERTSTPRAFRRRGRISKSPSSASRSPSRSPSPVRDATRRPRAPSPVDSNSEDTPAPSRAPTPPPRTKAGTSKSRQEPDPPPEAPNGLHEYDTSLTSYERRPGRRGGRKKILVNGKMEIDRTPMERLVHRLEKHKYVCRKGHPFGRKHGCYFNPYSYSKINEKICTRIKKPKGFQVGRGNNPIHEVIGLRSDYDYMSDILGATRKACIRFRPRRVELEVGQALTWGHYSSGDRKAIHNY